MDHYAQFFSLCAALISLQPSIIAIYVVWLLLVYYNIMATNLGIFSKSFQFMIVCDIIFRHSVTHKKLSLSVFARFLSCDMKTEICLTVGMKHISRRNTFLCDMLNCSFFFLPDRDHIIWNLFQKSKLYIGAFMVRLQCMSSHVDLGTIICNLNLSHISCSVHMTANLNDALCIVFECDVWLWFSFALRENFC